MEDVGGRLLRHSIREPATAIEHDFGVADRPLQETRDGETVHLRLTDSTQVCRIWYQNWCSRGKRRMDLRQHADSKATFAPAKKSARHFSGARLQWFYPGDDDILWRTVGTVVSPIDGRAETEKVVTFRNKVFLSTLLVVRKLCSVFRCARHAFRTSSTSRCWRLQHKSWH